MSIVTNKQRKRKTITQSAGKLIAFLQHWKCACCKKELPPSYQIDHRIPLADGGTDMSHNLWALCGTCHANKTMMENQSRMSSYDRHLMTDFDCYDIFRDSRDLSSLRQDNTITIKRPKFAHLPGAQGITKCDSKQLVHSVTQKTNDLKGSTSELFTSIPTSVEENRKTVQKDVEADKHDVQQATSEKTTPDYHDVLPELEKETPTNREDIKRLKQIFTQVETPKHPESKIEANQNDSTMGEKQKQTPNSPKKKDRGRFQSFEITFKEPSHLTTDEQFLSLQCMRTSLTEAASSQFFEFIFQLEQHAKWSQYRLRGRCRGGKRVDRMISFFKKYLPEYNVSISGSEVDENQKLQGTYYNTVLGEVKQIKGPWCGYAAINECAAVRVTFGKWMWNNRITNHQQLLDFISVLNDEELKFPDLSPADAALFHNEIKHLTDSAIVLVKCTLSAKSEVIDLTTEE
jgi:hypothetical protein